MLMFWDLQLNKSIRYVCLKLSRPPRHIQRERTGSNFWKVGLSIMDNDHEVEEQDASITVGVMVIPGEPAVVVNGVPDPSPEFLNDTKARQLVRDSVSESIEFYGQGEWLKGRKVLKKFGKKYYKGKVKSYDPESNWYKVVYEDGDSEDMEFCELQMVMVPLDIKSPLKTWLLKLAKFNTPKEKREKRKENWIKAKRAEMKKKTKGSGPHCASQQGHCLGCK